MRGKWPQGASGLARRKHENPQGEGWAGDGAQERAKEGLVKEGREESGRKCPGNGSQPGLRVARRGGGRSRLCLELVWATLPRVAGKVCMLGWQLEEEAELESFRVLKPCGREEVTGTCNGEEGTDLRLRGSSSTSWTTSVGMEQVRQIRPARFSEAGGKGSTLQGAGQVEQGMRRGEKLGAMAVESGRGGSGSHKAGAAPFPCWWDCWWLREMPVST